MDKRVNTEALAVSDLELMHLTQQQQQQRDRLAGVFNGRALTLQLVVSLPFLVIIDISKHLK